MTGSLSEIEELRLENLKLLHGKAAKHIAPTSNTLEIFLKTKKIKISKATISNIYLRHKAIDESLAEQIEFAFDLQPGWLSTNHNLWLSASSEDLLLTKQVLTMPAKAKQHLSELLKQLSK